MSGSIWDWSTTAASNGNADAGINFAEGQAPSTVNDSARQVMGREAELLKDLGGGIAAAGTANALTLTAASAFTAYKDGLIVAFRAVADNAAGVTTINVNGISAKSIRKMVGAGETDLAAGDIKNGGIFVLRYGTAFNGAAGAWMLLNPVVDIGISVHAAASKATPIDADEFGGTDSASSFALAKFTWANIKTTMKSYLNGFYGQLTVANSFTTSQTITDSAGQAIGVNSTPTAGSNGLQVNTLGPSPSTGQAAFMSFARTGSFGANFGIDTDNYLKVGGWNFGANAYKLLHEGLDIGTFTGSYTFSGTVNITGAIQKSGTAFPITKLFESSQQTITSGGSLTLAHGLGVQPKHYAAFVQCVTAEFGYSIGQEMPMTIEYGGTAASAMAIVPDATNINIRFGNASPVFAAANFTTGAQVSLTNANWKLVVRAWA